MKNEKDTFCYLLQCVIRKSPKRGTKMNLNCGEILN